MLALGTGSAQAQRSSFFELSVGGGWSNMLYATSHMPEKMNFRQNGDYAYMAHFAYGYRFNPYIGLGIGAELSRYGGGAELSGTLRWDGVQDTHGETYNHRTIVHRLRDVQEVTYVEVPLALHLFVPMGKAELQFQLGAKYGLPLWERNTWEGDITHEGDYPQWNMTLYDVAGHGFYREKNMQGEGALKTKGEVVAFAKVGFSTELSRKVRFFMNVYVNYGLMSAFELPKGDKRIELGVQNDRPGQSQTHYFMQPYKGLMQTNIVGDKVNPIQAGAELGFRFVIPHKVKFPCNCYMWN